jgi:hypothetical protein
VANDRRGQYRCAFIGLTEVQAKRAVAKVVHKPNMRTLVCRPALVHSSRA